MTRPQVEEFEVAIGVSGRNMGDKEPWNGEFYVSYGPTTTRSWEEAQQYGFISAGGGTWYSRTLKLLSPGSRIWVKIPKTGYVGVGTVTGEVSPARDFKLMTPSGEQQALEILKYADNYKQHVDDMDNSEYFVPVKWLDTVSESKAINEVGLFGNQNTVCEPTTPKWRHTVDRLKTYFRNWNQGGE